jgi:hypothetical protein
MLSAPVLPAGLLALKAATISNTSAGSASLAMSETWLPGTNPCHDYLPNCTTCSLAMPSSSCGAAAPAPGPAPARYCNWKMVACVDGRVQQLVVDGGAAALTALPADLTLLDRLATLGTPCLGAAALAGVHTADQQQPAFKPHHCCVLRQTSRRTDQPVLRACPPAVLSGVTIQAGPLPAAWASPSFPALTNLTLAVAPGSAAVGAINTAWAALPARLAHLHLEGLSLTPPLPQSWGSQASLRSLVLRRLAFAAPTSLPDSWSAMSIASMTLDSLDNVTGPLPATWAGGLANLSDVAVSGMGQLGQLSDLASLVVGPGKSSPLFNLSLSSMSMAGQTVPAALCGSGRAQRVALAGLQLAGGLGDCWRDDPGLQLLDLSGNALTGGLPAAWADAQWVGAEVNVSLNQLSGPLPEAWGVASGITGHTIKLALLDASFNGLTGGAGCLEVAGLPLASSTCM